MITIDQLPEKSIDAARIAWPGAFLYPLNKTRLILPLPLTENSDDKA